MQTIPVGVMNDEQLLAEVEELLRTGPRLGAFRGQNDEAAEQALCWLGRTAAVLNEWDEIRSIGVPLHISALHSSRNDDLMDLPKSTRVINQILDRSGPAYRELRTLLYEAQHNLRAKTIGPVSVVIPAQHTFDYFDELRKIIEMAREDLLFVDTYLDAEFVSRYLSLIAGGVEVRLLTSRKLRSLLPALKLLANQCELRIDVRSPKVPIHDRHVFVDKRRCYQSGASFKDGAKLSPTTLTQITDAFEAMYQTYQNLWDDGRVEFGADIG